jgi:SAM-dependent methyltransferase
MQRFRPGGTVVDFGGGNGFMSAAIAAGGMPTILVEASGDGVRNAKSRGLSALVQADIENLMVIENSIPAIGLFDVLEHIESDKDLLCKIRSWLKPDGGLYLTVPSGPWLWSNEDVRAGHFRRYSLRKLKRLLEECGFRVEYAGHAFAFLVLPVFFARTLASHLGFRRQKTEAFKREIGVSKNSLNRILKWFLRVEKSAFANGWRIPFGTSVVVFARPASKPRNQRVDSRQPSPSAGESP